MDNILLIAQVSSQLTVLIGIIAVFRTFMASRKMAGSEEFRKIIILSTIFLALSIIGTTSMAYYHITESTAESELADSIWCIFMFAAIIFSVYESFRITKINKRLSFSPRKIGRKKRVR